MEPPDPLLKPDTVAHTVRFPLELNKRAMVRAADHETFNDYILWVVTKDLLMPDIPDCASCGYRHMGEYMHAMLSGKTLFNIDAKKR